MTAQEATRDLRWLQASTAATIPIAAGAEILGVDERTVSRGMADGQIPCVAVGRRKLIPRLPVLAMLTGQQQGADTDGSAA